MAMASKNFQQPSAVETPIDQQQQLQCQIFEPPFTGAVDPIPWDAAHGHLDICRRDSGRHRR